MRFRSRGGRQNQVETNLPSQKAAAIVIPVPIHWEAVRIQIAHRCTMLKPVLWGCVNQLSSLSGCGPCDRLIFTALSQEERPRLLLVKGGCNCRMPDLSLIRCMPSQASIQTQRKAGWTSQLPSCLTPPQGPLRNSFGQFIGHDIPVDPRRQSPHIWQSNSRVLK